MSPGKRFPHIGESSRQPARSKDSPRLWRFVRHRSGWNEIATVCARETLTQTLETQGFSVEAFSPAFRLLDDLQRVGEAGVPLPNWRTQLPESSSWWFLIDRYFGQDPLLTTGFVMTNGPLSTHEQS